MARSPLFGMPAHEVDGAVDGQARARAVHPQRESEALGAQVDREAARYLSAGCE